MSGAGFCVGSLEAAIKDYGMPEIFNTGQGSQFTGDSFTGVLIKNGITISMDGRGRALGNIFVERLWRTVKYEDVYLKKDENMPGLLLGLTHHFLSYNEERLHQSLGYTTPDVVYQTATGGGAKIVDKFSGSVNICLDRGESTLHVAFIVTYRIRLLPGCRRFICS